MFSPHQRVHELKEEKDRLYALWYADQRDSDAREDWFCASAKLEGYELALSDLKELLS